MRWILGSIIGFIGFLAAEYEGLFLGLGLGLLIGWIIEREQKRSRFVGGDGSTAPVNAPRPSTGASFEQRASARIIELTKRVAQLEQDVSALRAALSTSVGAAPSAAQSSDGSALARAAVDVQTPALESSAAVTASVTDASGARAAQPAYAGGDTGFDERGAPLPSASTAGVESPAISDNVQRPASETLASGSHREAAASAAAGAVDAQSGVGTPSAQPVERAIAAVRELLFGGNTVVRIGVLVLTIGVGLLAKYAAEQAYFPLELRLACAALVGIGLVVFGFRTREKRPGFATALQGGGIAALYLVTFFSFYSYELLPAALTLPLLISIALLSAVLALAQDAQQLAVFGALGGFLSPILASTGGGSHVALFSYYALLNAALVGMALFRSWRVLNWTGFVFTFGVASAWGALRYEAQNMASASAFLALFFLLYVLDGTLFALRSGPRRRGTIDTTLTFGTPLATLALAGGLFHEAPLYLALACAAMAAVYLASAAALIRLRDEALATLSRAYVAIGIGVATLAVPFALENALATALAWAVEASGLIWVGAKQQRLRTRCAGYALFLGSVFALLARIESASMAGRALFCALIALALAFSAAVLDRRRAALRAFEPYVGHVLFGLSVFLWLGALHIGADEALVPAALHELTLLSLLAGSVLLFELVGARVAYEAPRKVARFIFPLLLLSLPGALSEPFHPFANFAWLGWCALFAAGFWALHRQRDERESALTDALHASGAWTFALLITIEVLFVARAELVLSEGWVHGLTLLAPLIVVACALRALPRWPVAAHPRAYVRWTAWPLCIAVALLALFLQMESNGSAAPLPYLPLLNPLDVAHAFTLLALVAVAKHERVRSPLTRKVSLLGALGSAFIALNATVVRTVHHWAAGPFEPWQFPTDPLVQATFSILWSALALLAMVFAHRRRARGVWLAGAALLAAVVVKLFLLDLAKLSSVAKIVTFLVVGMLLLAVGYFAPVPPPREREPQP